MSSGRVVLLYDKVSILDTRLSLSLTPALQHFRGNLGIILRPSPGLIDPDSVDQPSDEGLRTYWVFVLVSQSTKDKEDGECHSTRNDSYLSLAPSRFRSKDRTSSLESVS